MIDEPTRAETEAFKKPDTSVYDDIGEPDQPQTLARADDSRPVQVIVVAVHEAVYSLRVETVREILRVPKITWVPWTPDYIVGIVNARGEMLPVVDVSFFLQHGVSQRTDKSRIVVVESGDLVAGLLVDALVDVLDVPMTSFQAVADDGGHQNGRHLDGHHLDEERQNLRPYCAGQFQWQGLALTLLDSDRLLQGIVVNQG